MHLPRDFDGVAQLCAAGKQKFVAAVVDDACCGDTEALFHSVDGRLKRRQHKTLFSQQFATSKKENECKTHMGGTRPQKLCAQLIFIP